MARLRTFIAVEIPDSIRASVRRLIEKFSQTSAGVRWVKPDNIHLTLKFLGDVEETDIYRVCQKARDAAEASDPFQIRCVGAGAFPSLERPRTVWLGIDDPDGTLGSLHSRLDKGLRQLGFPKESRKFHPHLTLGRLRYNRRGSGELKEALAQETDLDVGAFAVNELVVFSSDLTPEGPVYTALARCPLAVRNG